MTFVVDEGVDAEVVRQLRSEGHEVFYIAEIGRSAPDEAVLDIANAEAAVLITQDKDFGEIVFREGKFTSGVFLLGLGEMLPNAKAILVGGMIHAHGDSLPGSFSVFTERNLRIRRQKDRS